MSHSAKSRIAGCFYMLAAMLCFSCMSAAIRLASGYLPTAEIVFLRNLFSILIFVPWLLKEGTRVLNTKRMKGHFWRAALGIVSMQMMFYAIVHLPLAQVTALSFSTPIFVILFALFYMGEQMNKSHLVSLALGFAGAMVILRPLSGSIDPLALMVLLSSAMMAAITILVKTLTTTERSGVIVFYMAFFMTPLALPPAMMVWQTPSWTGLGLSFLVALLSSTSHFFLTKAYQRAPMVVIMPIDFTRLLFTSTLAYLLFDERLDVWTVMGAMMIVSGAVVSAGLGAKRLAAKLRFAEQVDVRE